MQTRFNILPWSGLREHVSRSTADNMVSTAAKSAGTLCLRLLGRLQAAPLKLIQLLLRLTLWHQWVKSLWTRSFPFDLNLQLLEEASGCRPQQLPRSNRSLWRDIGIDIGIGFAGATSALTGSDLQIFQWKGKRMAAGGIWKYWTDWTSSLIWRPHTLAIAPKCQTNQAAFFKAAQKNGQEIDIP